LSFPLNLLGSLRQIVTYYDGRYVVHSYGSEYVKVLEVGDNYVVVGFEDLDRDLGFEPDFDYNNPRLKIYYVDGLLLFSLVINRLSYPVANNTIKYLNTKIFSFTKPGERTEPSFILVDAFTGSIIDFGDHLRFLVVKPVVAVTVPAVWGERMVKVGTTLDLYATAESNGLTIRIVIVKPDGSKVEDVMQDLGDGNYKYTFTFDQAGQYLIEIIYPDGYKKKRVVLAY